MPSLMRFLFVCLLLAGIGAAAMVYLAYFVQPTPKETTIRIPAERLTPR